MKKIKDFFYDKNDIFIVIIIVAIAAFIIYTRIGAIMDYPEQYASEIAKTTNTTQLETSVTETTSKKAASETTKESTTKATKETEKSKTVTIKISDNDTSYDVCVKLREAGLVNSAEKFDEYISKKGKSSSIKSGTFTIPSDATDAEILNIIS